MTAFVEIFLFLFFSLGIVGATVRLFIAFRRFDIFYRFPFNGPQLRFLQELIFPSDASEITDVNLTPTQIKRWNMWAKVHWYLLYLAVVIFGILLISRSLK